MSDTKQIEKKEESKSVKSAAQSKGLKDLRLELQRLVLDVRSGKEKNTSLIRKAKKEIARLLNNLRNK